MYTFIVFFVAEKDPPPCDTLPLRDVATLSSLAYYERGLRTSGDRQRIASTAPQFAAEKAFTKHPRSDADQLLRKVCEKTGLSPDHARAQRCEWSRYHPWDTGPAEAITIAFAPSDPTINRESPEETRRNCSLQALALHQPADYDLWTDGSCREKSDNHEAASAGAWQIYKDDALLLHGASPAGILACSYRAECIAMAAGLEELGKQPLAAGSKVLVATDSQSLLASLHRGPLLTNDDCENLIWSHLLQLAARKVSVHLQFVFAHCGVERNESVDKLAGEALALPQDNVPVWLPDLMAAARAIVRAERAAAATMTVRTRLVGFTPTPLDTSAPRRVSVLLARMRVDTTPLVGKYRHTIGLAKVPTCRWCCPQHHLEEAPEEGDRRARTRGGSRLPHTCPICQVVSSTRHNLLVHIERLHPDADAHALAGVVRNEPAPVAAPPVDPAALLKCPKPGCNTEVKRKNWLSRHMRKCCPELLAPPPPPPPPPPPGALETVEHVVLECPALDALRREYNIINCKKTWFNTNTAAFLDRALDQLRKGETREQDAEA